MRNNETGEFELVVGNHQLLSGFFIVVLLFAVAFAMGYVVGQNSPRSAKVQAENTVPAPSAVTDTRPQPAGPAPVSPASAQAPTPDASAAEAAVASDAPAQPTTQPAREPQTVAATAPVSASPAPPTGSASSLPAGSFWQVMAVAQADSDLIAKTLKDKGFPVVLSQGPNNLIRVLVGPYNDVQVMGKAKLDLENAGFLHPFRYQRDR